MGRWGSAVTLESKGSLSTLVNEEVAVLRRRVKRTLIMMARLPVNDASSMMELEW